MFRLLLLQLTCGAAALSAPGAQNEMITAADQANSIVISNGAWNVTFYPDGRAFALYGSRGLGGYLPKGTVKFDALLAAVRTLKGKPGIACTTEVVVWPKNVTSTTSFTISDDTLFRYLIASFADKWEDKDQRPVGEEFRKLLKKYPIYPDESNR